MRKSMLLMAGLLLPCLLMGQPKFSISPGFNFDFGDVFTGLTVKQLMTIKNVGTDTLVISELGSSCGCTGTLMSNSHIAPSDSGILSITFETKRFSGKVEKMVHMFTNDTSHKRVEIRFTANVTKILDATPDYLFLRGRQDSTISGHLEIKNLSSERIKILSVTPTLASVSAEISTNSLKPGEAATLTATFKPTAPGTLNGNIEVKTDHPKVPVLSVRFYAWIKETGSQATEKQK